MPIAVRCEPIRLSSIISTRSTFARVGISASMPSRRSTPMQYAASLKIGAR